MTKRLIVELDFGDGPRPLARLGWDPGARQAVAEWDAGFQQTPLPVSPLLSPRPEGLLRPRERSFGDLPALFGDSLPDGWGRLLIDRDLAARGRPVAAITDLDRLALVGRHGMGALTFRPEDVPDIPDALSLDWFDGRVAEMGGGVAADDLERLRAMAGGSQGARPKFVAQIATDNAALRSHRVAPQPGWRHVIVKRRAATDAPGAIEAELAYARMAAAAGIDLPPMTLLRARSGEAHLVADRFDRSGTGQRHHMQSVAALLGADFRTATMDYAQMLKLLRVVTRDHRAVEQMLLRMIFNARALNRDDHLKNHALLMDAAGEWRLSPAYDVSFSVGPGGEHALLIGGEGKRPGRDAFARVAADAGVKPARLSQMVAAVDAALADWPRHAGDAGVPKALRDQIAAALRDAAGW